MGKLEQTLSLPDLFSSSPQGRNPGSAVVVLYRKTRPIDANMSVTQVHARMPFAGGPNSGCNTTCTPQSVGAIHLADLAHLVCALSGIIPSSLHLYTMVNPNRYQRGNCRTMAKRGLCKMIGLQRITLYTSMARSANMSAHMSGQSCVLRSHATAPLCVQCLKGRDAFRHLM